MDLSTIYTTPGSWNDFLQLFFAFCGSYSFPQPHSMISFSHCMNATVLAIKFSFLYHFLSCCLLIVYNLLFWFYCSCILFHLRSECFIFDASSNCKNVDHSTFSLKHMHSECNNLRIFVVAIQSICILTFYFMDIVTRWNEIIAICMKVCSVTF